VGEMVARAQGRGGGGRLTRRVGGGWGIKSWQSLVVFE
jgi:hypothetical protein